MKVGSRLAVICTLILVSVALASAQKNRRDPLTDSEVDQLRETAQDAPKRMKLLVGFAKARMQMIDQMRADPTVAGKNDEQLRKAIEDLGSIVDEIDDNLDMYNGRSEDLRKPLKTIIEMDSDFQLKLRALKETSSEAQLKNYGFALESTTDAVNESADSARAMMEDQLAKRGKVKESNKPEKEEKQKPSGPDIKPPCSPC